MKKLFKNIIDSELRFFASRVIKKFKPFIIGVTGSSGKTTEKYMIVQLLKASGKSVNTSETNLNTRTGLPMSILGFSRSPENPLDWLGVFFSSCVRYFALRTFPDFLVVEFAADKPGDINYLASFIRPQIAVITNIGVAHIEIFKNVKNITKEKWSLAQAAENHIIISSSDYDKVKDRAASAQVTKIEEGPVKIKKREILSNKTEFEVQLFEKKFSTQTKFLGAHNLLNIQLALTACYFAGCDFYKMVKKIPGLEPRTGRGKRTIGRNEIMIIDESYNANPLSMIAALENLASVKYARKVAIIGQMAEIGPVKQRSHQEVAVFAKKCADFVVGVGEDFRGQNLDKWYPNVEELIEEIETVVLKGDAVLIKGSHSTNLDKVVDRLT